MALIGARGTVLVVCFLLVAGLFEYLIIMHMYSGQKRIVPFFSDDWNNPQLSDGFSKVDSVEVENVEAKFKKIKFFPAAKNPQEWKERKKEILKDWIAVDSVKNRENANQANVNIQPPPSAQPNKNGHHEKEVDYIKEQERGARSPRHDVQGVQETDSHRRPLRNGARLEREIGSNLQAVRDEDWLKIKEGKALDKKAEDYNYDDDYRVDEHSRRKGVKDTEEEVVGRKANDDGGGGDQLKVVDLSDQKHRKTNATQFEKAARALAALSNFKKAVKTAFWKNEKEKEESVKPKEQKPVEIPLVVNDYSSLNSPFYNGRALEGEVLVETNKRLHYRQLSTFEAAGNNIMFTLRTTKAYHDKRLPLLFETWMRKANHSNIFIVTDGEDEKWLKKTWDESK